MLTPGDSGGSGKPPKSGSGGGPRPSPSPAPAPTPYSPPPPSYTPPSYSPPSTSGGTPAPSYDQINVQKLTPMPATELTQLLFGSTGVETEKREISGMFGPFNLNERPKPEPKVRKADQPPTKPAKKSYEMSWQDYQALTDRERAAVDFNTMLIQAREKDLNTQYSPTQKQTKTYGKTVDKMFPGDEGGSDIYAPETVALLKTLDFKGDEKADLDKFLNLKAAITTRELGKLDIQMEPVTIDLPVVGETVLPTGQTPQVELTNTLVDKTQELQETLARGNQLLASYADSVALVSNDFTRFFGGDPNKVKEPLGFGSTVVDQDFMTAYDALADKSTQLSTEQIGQIINANGPEEARAFTEYVDLRTKQALEYGLPLGETKGVKYRSPQEFRELLGLGKGGE